MNKWLWVTLVALGACDCSAATTGGGGACVTAGDCVAGEVCIDGMCRAGARTDSGAGCADGDGDGFGDGCAAGPDCNDADAMQTGTERCDGSDNDCDGLADEGVRSPCGDCNPMCESSGLGGDDPGFDLMTDESDGVGLDDEGALVLDSRAVNTNFIWIANTGEGSVSRFSTTAPYQEVGRYFTGASGGGNDPSRTSVNSVGDAFVGNRTDNAITRISVLGTGCPDTNGDGMVRTSQDLNGDNRISNNLADGEMLAFGDDDCVLWHKQLDDALPGEGHMRAVAAQDIRGPDGELREYVWVGGWDLRRAAKLDARTGAVILSTEAPVNTYGFALDGNGQLWISSPSGAIGRIDTNRCVDDASCAEAVCTASAPEGAECDAAVKAAIPAPHTPYGITVDFEQRVWIGGTTAGAAPTYGRYIPTAPSGNRWVSVMIPVGSASPWIHGIGADAVGNIWGAGYDAGVFRIDANNPTSYISVPGSAGVTNKGIGIDAEGKCWSITQGSNAVVVTPGPTLAENTVITAADGIVSPYTYSDMTGLQLRLATNPYGYYRHVFEACEADDVPDWGELRFQAETPEGTFVTFRAKTADTRDALETAMLVTLGTTPPDASPLSVSAGLMAAGVTPGRFLYVEIELRAERTSAMEVITPRVMSIDLTYECPSTFQ